MRRIFLRIAYDGTAYCGFQIQPNLRTVAGTVTDALGALTGAEITLIGASRTDTGVHALGNAAVFDTESRIPGEKFAAALNTRLPEDVRIMESYEVPLEFHPRYDCQSKIYEYRIYRGVVCPPTEARYAHFEYVPLDVEAMRQAAVHLVGEHNFQSFCAAGAQVKDTVRTILSVEVCERDEQLVIRVQGTGFLYHMVRILAGTLLLVGKHRLAPLDIPRILEARDRAAAGPTAPAKGLTLVHIFYPHEETSRA